MVIRSIKFLCITNGKCTAGQEAQCCKSAVSGWKDHGEGRNSFCIITKLFCNLNVLGMKCKCSPQCTLLSVGALLFHKKLQAFYSAYGCFFIADIKTWQLSFSETKLFLCIALLDVSFDSFFQHTKTVTKLPLLMRCSS